MSEEQIPLSKDFNQDSRQATDERSCLVGGEDEGKSYKSTTEQDEKKDGDTVGDTEKSEHRPDQENTTTNLQALMHLWKGNVGAGILGLPEAVMHAGIVVGPFALVGIALVTIHCMQLLVECGHILCRRTGETTLGYGEVAEQSIKRHYPKKAHLGRLLVHIFLCISQLGFCCVYFVFVADNLQQVSDALDIKSWIAVLLLPVMLLSFIRDLRTLAPLSTAANILGAISLVIMFQYIIRNIHHTDKLPAFAGWSNLPVFFGIAMYAFEGIGVVLPIENKMSNPQDFSRIIRLGMGLMTVVFALIGIVGYLFCQDECRGSITLNLPHGGLYSGVKLLYAASIFLSYFLQFYVPMLIIQPPILKHIPEDYHFYADYGIRATTVLLTCIMAVAIPQLDNIISLVGSISCTSLAIIFPIIIHILTLSGEGSGHIPLVTLVKDAAILLVGVLMFVFGTYTSFARIIQRYKNSEN